MYVWAGARRELSVNSRGIRRRKGGWQGAEVGGGRKQEKSGNNEWKEGESGGGKNYDTKVEMIYEGRKLRIRSTDPTEKKKKEAGEGALFFFFFTVFTYCTHRDSLACCKKHQSGNHCS